MVLTSEPSGVGSRRALNLAYLTPIRFFPILGSLIRVLKDQVDFWYIPTVCILLHVIFISFFTVTGKVFLLRLPHPGSKISQDLWFRCISMDQLFYVLMSLIIGFNLGQLFGSTLKTTDFFVMFHSGACSRHSIFQVKARTGRTGTRFEFIDRCPPRKAKVFQGILLLVLGTSGHLLCKSK